MRNLGIWLLGWTLFGSVVGPAAAETAPGADAPCATPEARQFDFWIGEWNVRNRGLRAGGWRDTGEARAHVYPILDGCALVEQWQGTANDRKTLGFSVRAYDPVAAKWVLVLNWPAPNQPGFGSLEGSFRHGRGEFFNTFERDGQETIQRYTFSDASPDTLRWDAAYSDDGGRSWLTRWIMELTRRDPLTDPPLRHGPWIADGRPRHCSQPEAAELDFLAGPWEGVEEHLAADGGWVESRVRATVTPILEGCALMQSLEREDDGYERFAVRSWVPGLGRWVQYALDDRHPVFVRTEGTFADGRIELVTPEGAEGPRRRVTWSRDEDGTLRRESATAAADGAWNTTSRITLEPTYRHAHPTPAGRASRELARAFLAGEEAGAARYRELRQAHPEVVGEALLNSLGYGLMAQGQVEAALAVFRFNVAEHPESWNVHDSLGEAYLRTGQSEKAIASYRRSLELNPGNDNGRQKLEQLEEEPANEE